MLTNYPILFTDFKKSWSKSCWAKCCLKGKPGVKTLNHFLRRKNSESAKNNFLIPFYLNKIICKRNTSVIRSCSTRNANCEDIVVFYSFGFSGIPTLCTCVPVAFQNCALTHSAIRGQLFELYLHIKLFLLK